MHEETLSDVFQLAISAEEESLKRYLEFAIGTKDENGKNMFIRLAQDEFMHQRLLKRMLEELKDKGTCSVVETPPTVIEKLVPKIGDKSLRVKGKEGQSALDALLTALNLEINARNFYQKQAETAGPESVRAVFLRLAQMEQAHSELIQAEIDYIQKTGFWFGFQEFTLEANP
ncbi:MAG: ferritin family protein [candidate division WOR-3 bacterium]